MRLSDAARGDLPFGLGRQARAGPAREGIGLARSPEVVVGYLGVAVILYACHKYATVAPHVEEVTHGAATSAAE